VEAFLAVPGQQSLPVLAQSVREQNAYDEPWRPQFHFTPAKNFMNDPNERFIYKGNTSLHQHSRRKCGDMSWGRRQPDMVH
jgi:sucrose-6-phosphate hydrolase SacC (GH32 family)